MSTFSYIKLEKSIEDTPFQYITKVDDYKAFRHILDVMIMEKVRSPLLQAVFAKVSIVLNNTIEHFDRVSKNGIIEVSKLISYCKSNKEHKIILVRNEEHNSFASYPTGDEELSKLTSETKRTVYYNVGQLETSGSVSVVPTNANVFLSSLLYAYTLLFADKFYSRLNSDVLLNASKIFYTVILGVFGKKSGLLVGSRQNKEYLFFLTSSFIFAIYARKEQLSSSQLRQFLGFCSSNTGSSFFNQYQHMISNVDLKNKSEVFDPDNFNSLFKITNVLKQIDLMEVSESEMRIQLFRMLSVYGIMALENYIRFVAYLVATYLPNSYFTSTLKVYNKASYEYLTEYFIKELYSFT